MPTGKYDRPTYKVKCTICGVKYTQHRKPVKEPKCKKCGKKLMDAKYHSSHKEEAILYSNKKEVKARKAISDKKYYNTNKLILLKKQGVYYQENKEHILKQAENYRRNRGELPNGISGTEKIALPYIQSLFPNEEIRLRDRKTIKNPTTGAYLELDFYIPSKKIGIELNGPTHYLPIYGQEKYKRQLRNDEIKRVMCVLKGIHLIEIYLEEGVHYDRFSIEHDRLKETLRRCLT